MIVYWGRFCEDFAEFFNVKKTSLRRAKVVGDGENKVKKGVAKRAHSDKMQKIVFSINLQKESQ